MRDAWINGQPVIVRLDAQHAFRQYGERPGSGTGQPGVLAFTEGRSVLAGYHLAVGIRFRTVDLGNVFQEGRAGLLVQFEGSVAMSHDGFREDDPWIVVAEDAGIFLVSRRI